MSKERKSLLLILAIALVFGSISALWLVRKDRILLGFVCLRCSRPMCRRLCGWLTITDTNQPSSYFFTTASGVYLAMVAAAIVFGYVVFLLPFGWYTAIHILSLAAYLITMIIGYSSHRYVTGQGNETRHQVIRTRMDIERVMRLGEAAAALTGDTQAAAKSILFEVEEKLRYSDPTQNDETSDLTQAVERSLDELDKTLGTLLNNQCDLTVLKQQAAATMRKIDACNPRQATNEIIGSHAEYNK